jgi:hypothetical protein
MIQVEFGQVSITYFSYLQDEYSKEDGLSLRNLTLLFCYLCIFGVKNGVQKKNQIVKRTGETSRIIVAKNGLQMKSVFLFWLKI